MPYSPDPTNATWPLGPPVAPYMVGEGTPPAAPLAPVDLTQSNVEGNQLKHIFQITWECTDRGFSSLGPTAGDYPVMPQSGCGIFHPRQ